ncbi:MAG: SOS response-associated peptidase [Stellaceae bacterium]
MCNYFTRYREPRRLEASFRFVDPLPNLEPRYVVRPTDTERVVAIGGDGRRHFVAMRWGLVPFWARDMKTGLTLFNWRSEDVLAKPIFAAPFNHGRRCLVPCDGFFEFTGLPGAKQPYFFQPKDGRVMAFAGLWAQWRGPRGRLLAEPLLSFSIATCAPNRTVAPYHDRMPVLFTRAEDWDGWLDPGADADALRQRLAPADDDLLEVTAVTRQLLKLKEPGPEVLRSEPA